MENDDLLTLESRIGKFNIFDALGLSRVEIRHSNFLAFILDPGESHGQGQRFLKAVLMDLLKSAPPELRPLSPIKLDGIDLRGVEVRREWKNIDLLIFCKEPRFAIVVENKVGSGEHSDQLSRYRSVMSEHYSGTPTLFVYLSPDGDEPSEEVWTTYTYADVHRVLARVREAHLKAIGDEVLVFLDHYLNLLGTRFMNDEKLDELCRRIYKNHRQALDLIWERVGSPASSTFVEMCGVLEIDSRWHEFYRSNRYVEFVPKSWLQWLPPIGIWDEPRYWVTVHLKLKEQEIVYTVFVGPTKDGVGREEIVNSLREAAPSVGLRKSKAGKVGGKWDRVTGAESILQWDEGEEPAAETVREGAKKAFDGLFPKLEKLGAVLMPLCNLAARTESSK